jgi:hypothetical protein
LIGLWPHEGWLSTGEQREYWLTRNKETVSRLKSGTSSLLHRIYDLNLNSPEQTARLFELLSSTPDIEAAAARVAVDPAWCDLGFPWDFASHPETVVITLGPLQLPQREDGYQVLKLQEQPHLPLSWSTDPAPAHVPALTHYLVELLPAASGGNGDDQLAHDGAETALRSEAIAPGKSAHKRYRVKDLKTLVDTGQLPEGLYRARVTAWAKATNITRQASTDTTNGAQSNISDYFWIEWTQEEQDIDAPPQRRERMVSSYLEARREVQWELLARKQDPWSLPESACVWDNASKGGSIQVTCTVQFGRQTFHIRLSHLLRRMEAHILAKPEALGALTTHLTYGMAAKDIALIERSDLPRLSPNDTFLAARSALFAKLRGEDGQGLVATTDLLQLRSDIVAYVREYVALLRDAQREVGADPKRWLDRVGLATMDTVRVRLPGLSEQTSMALLLVPTHPLQLLWSLQLALLGEAWLKETQRRGTADALSSDAKQALQEGLQPVNIPPVLFDHRRVGYLHAGQVAPGWVVYLPTDIADTHSAVARLSRVLTSTTRPLNRGAKASEVADRVLRYLQQHPYVSELQIDVFNPGDGQIIIDLLNEIDKQYPELRYEVRLFSHDEVRDDLGSTLDQLVNPELTVTTSEMAEKYAQASRYPLHPNLRYSKHRIVDFLRRPGHFQSHISLLLDLFHPRIDIAPAFTDQACTALFGLVHEETVRTSGSQGQFAWERQVIPRAAKEIEPTATEATLLTDTLAAIQQFVAALGASPADCQGRLPTIKLDLTVDGQNLLYEIHRVSDWVLTIDRHLGIDYFDSAVNPEESGTPAILLDFAPEFSLSDQAVLMLTTQVGSEIDHLVEPVLQRLGLDLPGSGRKIVEWLRSLSGRLAMRLLAAPMASQGVLGMALARAFLDRLAVLQDTIIIPVDAHVELLRRGSRDDATHNRTDLILLRSGVTGRQLEFTLVEVKCSAGLFTAAGYHTLREEIEKQVAQTQVALASLFDPLQQNPDHLDRPLRNRVLSRWLRFYIGRARRYGLLSAEAERTFLDLLMRLDAGYTVSFRQLGIIFELGREDDVEDTSSDVVIHRIGRLSCERLLRGDDLSPPTPPTWDRLQTAIYGETAWARMAPEQRSHQQNVPTNLNAQPTAPAEVPEGDANVQASEAGASVISTANEEVPGPLASMPLQADVSPRTHKIADKHDLAVLPAYGGVNQTAGDTASRGTTAVEARTAVSCVRSSPSCHYLVGDTKVTAQWGILGKLGGEVVGLDLNGCNTLSIFGVQGAGKSYTMGSILEMAIRPLPGLNVLPQPLAAVVFHYNESEDYTPEFVSMLRPNSVDAEVVRLREEYRGEPQGLEDILVLAPADKVSARQRAFPGLTVEPIAFHPAELTIQDWRFLMGAVGNDSLYIRELNLILRVLRDNITLEGLRQGVEESQLSEAQRKLVRLRLRFAEQFVRDGDRLRNKLYPGRLVIVDLRDEQSALRADSENLSPVLRDRLVARLRRTCPV